MKVKSNAVFLRMKIETICSVQANRKADLSGVVINTCGWVQAEGYDHIKHIAQVRQICHLQLIYFDLILGI